MSRAKELIIDALVDNLFRSSQLSKEEAHRRSAQKLQKSLDAYVQPFVLREQDKTLGTGLRSIVTAPGDMGVSLPKIYIDQFLPSLHLEVPKKVIQYVAAAAPIVDPVMKSKQVRAKGARGPQKQFVKTAKRSLPEVASIYNEAPEEGSDTEQPAQKKTRSSLGRGNGDDGEAIKSIAIKAEVPHEVVNRRAIPKNFYTVVAPIMDEFWNMEFDNEEVTWAFFALITHLNCKDYRLNAFAEQSYSLTVIKEKLKKQSYVSPDDFVYDFTQLFGNITTYYPETHEAYIKARELSVLFDTRWKEAQSKFR